MKKILFSLLVLLFFVFQHFLIAQSDCTPPTNDLFQAATGCYEENTGSWIRFGSNTIETSTDWS
ncbi:MAG: hypothetical protein GY932_10960, partial [Arcobacter sp.]|nr:hypothetical protein [Arcobacter sp.]